MFRPVIGIGTFNFITMILAPGVFIAGTVGVLFLNAFIFGAKNSMVIYGPYKSYNIFLVSLIVANSASIICLDSINGVIGPLPPISQYSTFALFFIISKGCPHTFLYMSYTVFLFHWIIITIFYF